MGVEIPPRTPSFVPSTNSQVSRFSTWKSQGGTGWGDHFRAVHGIADRSDSKSDAARREGATPASPTFSSAWAKREQNSRPPSSRCLCRCESCRRDSLPPEVRSGTGGLIDRFALDERLDWAHYPAGGPSFSVRKRRQRRAAFVKPRAGRMSPADLHFDSPTIQRSCLPCSEARAGQHRLGDPFSRWPKCRQTSTRVRGTRRTGANPVGHPNLAAVVQPARTSPCEGENPSATLGGGTTSCPHSSTIQSPAF